MAQPLSLYVLLGLPSGNRGWQECDQRCEVFCRHMKHSRHFARLSGHPLQTAKKGEEKTSQYPYLFHLPAGWSCTEWGRRATTSLVWPLHTGMLWYLHPDKVLACGNIMIQWSTTNSHCSTWQIHLVITCSCWSLEYD